MSALPESTPRSAVLAALAIAGAAGFLLCGYEFVRSTSNTLFREAYGKENLPYINAIMPAGVLAMLYGYGWLLSRLGPRRTLLATSLLSGAAIGGCYLAIRAGNKPASGVLFIVREAYIVLLIEQYWSFLNSRLSVDLARRMNGPICGVGSVGGILGGLAVAQYSQELGTVTMLVFGALAIVPAALLSHLAHSIGGEPQRSAHDDAPPRTELGLELFRSHRVLLLLFGIIVATQMLSASLDLSWQGLLHDSIADSNKQNAYSGRFFAILNAAAALSQFAITPLLLRFIPPGVIFIAIPLLNMAACWLFFAEPTLLSAGIAYQAFKVLDYSLFRAAKEILYIPLPFDARYRAKEVIDVWGYRLSKGGTSAAIAFLKAGGAVFTTTVFAMMALGSAGVWLLLVIPILKHARSGKAAH